MSSELRITVRDGLGARITAIANGLSAGREVQFGWEANAHCPLHHIEVFPAGIPGVEFVCPDVGTLVTPVTDRPFFSWAGAFGYSLANAAYGTILEAMAGRPWGFYPLAIHARFHRHPTASPRPLAWTAVREARAAGIRTAFLLSDLHRPVITDILEAAGIQVIPARSAPLASDLARFRADTLAFLSDWKTLIASPLIVAGNGPTCLLNPARAAATNIVYSAL